jgi:RND family efflux transporter MFP subunit
VVAPFDGTITARNTDIGQLISNGGTELFHIADTRKLRIYAQVPQPYAPVARPGLAAELRFAAHPGKAWPAKIVHSADALDPATRTLQVQLQVDNSSGELLPGAYTEVHFRLPVAADTVRLPANALLFRAEGPLVATLAGDGRVRLQPVTLGRDFGAEVEVLNGLAAGQSVIINPPDSIVDLQPVRLAQQQKGGGDRPPAGVPSTYKSGAT